MLVAVHLFNRRIPLSKTYVFTAQNPQPKFFGVYVQWEKNDVIQRARIRPDQRRLREFYDWHSFVGDGNYIMHGVLWELIGNSNKKERKKKRHIFTTNNSANNNTIYILG